MIASEIERALNEIAAMRINGTIRFAIGNAMDNFIRASGWSIQLTKASIEARTKQREASPWRR
jgi:hypothetical protein